MVAETISQRSVAMLCPRRVSSIDPFVPLHLNILLSVQPARMRGGEGKGGEGRTLIADLSRWNPLANVCEQSSETGVVAFYTHELAVPSSAGEKRRRLRPSVASKIWTSVSNAVNRDGSCQDRMEVEPQLSLSPPDVAIRDESVGNKKSNVQIS